MNKRTSVLKRLVISLIVMMVLFVSGPALAQGSGATQGSVAVNLASMLGLSSGSAQDAIQALSSRGLVPATGWRAEGAADGNFSAALDQAVLAAFNAGNISPAGGLTTPSSLVAAACTAANIPQSEVVDAIKAAGGSGDDAAKGALYGSSSTGGTGDASSFGPAFDGSRPGSGGGGGAVTPSPNS